MKRKSKQLEGHQLYYFNTCPYCIAVRFVVWRQGLKLGLKNIASNSTYNADLLAGGGKSQVPCLRTENSRGNVEWMYESADIIRYLKSKAV